MREILFRGKRVKNNLWIEGTYMFYTGFHQEENHIITYRNGNPNDIIPETLGQYTGLTDKNGTKIFEGDIVKGSWNTIFVVYYDTDYLQYRAKVGETHREIDYYGNSNQIEVIGNIHDNPELLEVS